MTKTLTHTLASPIGPVTLVEKDGALVELRFGATRSVDGPGPETDVVRAFNRFSAGDLGALDAIPVAPEGTPFQKRVWEELRRIPPGTTISYAELAARIGRPTATRAVAAANGANPVAIVVPCHRVIAKDGTLHGYGGGLPAKKKLLEHEGLEVSGDVVRTILFSPPGRETPPAR
ncbi:MAG: methylated-DNA--[protein]-cysteine S-methyltransferase [Acidobacteria bacterium]|nr:methylated-DNA--[protein]-cysteine S-methyltransferase [Acidobacteriota bacterium]